MVTAEEIGYGAIILLLDDIIVKSGHDANKIHNLQSKHLRDLLEGLKRCDSQLGFTGKQILSGLVSIQRSGFGGSFHDIDTKVKNMERLAKLREELISQLNPALIVDFKKFIPSDTEMRQIYDSILTAVQQAKMHLHR